MQAAIVDGQPVVDGLILFEGLQGHNQLLLLSLPVLLEVELLALRVLD